MDAVKNFYSSVDTLKKAKKNHFLYSFQFFLLNPIIGTKYYNLCNFIHFSSLLTMLKHKIILDLPIFCINSKNFYFFCFSTKILSKIHTIFQPKNLYLF